MGQGVSGAGNGTGDEGCGMDDPSVSKQGAEHGVAWKMTLM